MWDIIHFRSVYSSLKALALVRVPKRNIKVLVKFGIFVLSAHS